MKDIETNKQKENPDYKIAEAEWINLAGVLPPMERMDSSALQACKKCKKLSLSTNNIDRISSMQGMGMYAIVEC